MATKTPTILGHTPCPICPETAQVRPDRNDLAYIYCANGCYTQVFTRDKHRDAMLRARMTPATAADKTPPPPSMSSPPIPMPVPAPTLTQPIKPTPAPIAPPKPAASWLKTLLD